MCVALPGIVKKISADGKTASVDFSGNLVNAAAGLVTLTEGDYVLVHAGCVIQKVKEDEANELAELFKELEEV
ncbi:MAG: HypC/HybG/HupF family hydrogenase formation chaperone [Lachnospiraceae bacterium]|nr:HypC/HybG/HupF family hydrogenase formation chaperone [Lachnospiraceae bacterium]